MLPAQMRGNGAAPSGKAAYVQTAPILALTSGFWARFLPGIYAVTAGATGRSLWERSDGMV
jgi:hypothetical protein